MVLGMMLVPKGLVNALQPWSDFYSQTELKNQPFYDLIHQDTTTRYAINLPLPAPPGRARKVGLFRTHRDFTERDRLALQLLRPHLHAVYLDAERAVPRRAAGAGRRRRADVMDGACAGQRLRQSR